MMDEKNERNERDMKNITPAPIAEEAERLLDAVIDAFDTHAKPALPILRAALAAAEARGEKRGMERAAKWREAIEDLADATGEAADDIDSSDAEGFRDALREASSELRALANGES